MTLKDLNADEAQKMGFGGVYYGTDSPFEAGTPWTRFLPNDLEKEVSVCECCIAKCPYAGGLDYGVEWAKNWFFVLPQIIADYDKLERSLLNALAEVGRKRDHAVTALRAATGEPERWYECLIAQERDTGCPYDGGNSAEGVM